MSPEKKRDLELERLIDWFKNLKQEIPKGIEICPGTKIVDPELFRKAILDDIATYPEGPRILTGALKGELQNLKFSLERLDRK